MKSFLLLPLVLLFFGCATYTQKTEHMRINYRSSDYAEALKQLEKAEVKNGSDELLYYLEKASILDKKNDLRAAKRSLLTADRIAEELYTESISKTAASFVYNDGAADYQGEDYERVGIHTLLALIHLEEKNLGAALVSAKKINNVLYDINSKYEEHENKYKEDAFARILSAMIYEARGNIDDAIIDYKKALKLLEGPYQTFFGGDIDEFCIRPLARLLKKRRRSSDLKLLAKEHKKIVNEVKTEKAGQFGELIVVHQLGTVTPKTLNEFAFGAGRKIVHLSFPIVSPRYTTYGKTGIKVKGKKFQRAENIQDMSSIAAKTLEDKRLRITAKSMARLVAKNAISDYAYEKYGPLGGLVATIYGAVTERGDTRSWTLFPDRFFISRMKLSPGTHMVDIYTDSGHSKEKVTIKKEKLTLLRTKDF